MNRDEALEKACDCVCRDREQDYGSSPDSYVDLAGYAALAGEITDSEAGKE